MAWGPARCWPTGSPDEAGSAHAQPARIRIDRPGFIRVLLRHGGHPMLVMRKAGGNVDAWNTLPDPGWHGVGAMR